MRKDLLVFLLLHKMHIYMSVGLFSCSNQGDNFTISIECLSQGWEEINLCGLPDIQPSILL